MSALFVYNQVFVLKRLHLKHYGTGLMWKDKPVFYKSKSIIIITIIINFSDRVCMYQSGDCVIQL